MNLPLSIALSLVVTFLNTTGYYLQKKGQNEIEPGLPIIKYFITAIKTPKWLIGFIVALLSMPVYIYAISIGHLSITQPLANTGIIFLVLMGIKYLKEQVGKFELVAVISLVAGIFLVSFAMPPPKETYTLVDAEILTFFITVACLIAGCIVAIFLKKKAIGFSILSGVCMGIAASSIKIISILISDLGYDSFSLLDIDFDMKLLLGVFGGSSNPFFIASLMFYVTIMFIGAQIVTLSLALKDGKLSFVMPVEMGTSFILPVFAGFFLFHEPANVLLVIGIVVALAGALLLTKVQASMQEKIEKEAPAAATT
ncbi:MAG: hypothetical protein ACTSU9_06360 [Promethearchaeota archaeon]